MKAKNIYCLAIVIIVIAANTSSCQSAVQRLGWETYNSADGRFSISTPGILQEEVTGRVHTFTSNDGYFTYVVSYEDYPIDIQDSNINDILDEFADQIIANGGEVTVERDISLGNFVGREFIAAELESNVVLFTRSRAYLVDNRVYRVHVRYLMPHGAVSEDIDTFFDSFKYLDDAEIERLRSITPTAIHPDFTMSFVKIHYCKGSSQGPRVALMLTNTGNVTFRKHNNLVTADNRNALYGQGVDMGYSSSGFDTSADECGENRKDHLRPGETAYISLALHTDECIPSCNAHAIIELCNDLTAQNTCAEQTVDFTVMQPTPTP